MLTTQDFQQNLRFISVGSYLAAYPIAVDLENGKLKQVKSKPMSRVCWTTYGCYTVHVAYIVLRLPYLLLTGVQIPLLSLLWHFTLLTSTALINYSHY